ncbi:hypothetical protein NL676_010825 [Syzygium grande]|nr:hypothetical protein NL676_010825 [Syzygium grande]
MPVGTVLNLPFLGTAFSEFGKKLPGDIPWINSLAVASKDERIIQMRTLIETSALGQHPRLQLPLAPSRHNRASHSRSEVNRALDLRSKARLDLRSKGASNSRN